jgi:hypothetical protein
MPPSFYPLNGLSFTTGDSLFNSIETATYAKIQNTIPGNDSTAI